jgi:AcrR family transcriptional regulator
MSVSFKQARREKIVDVAQNLFTTKGFRATSMEGIATAADLSKVTLYGYFKDKDTVFTAVAERMAERLKAAVVEGLATDGTASARITTALTAKHVLVFDVVRSSAHARELFEASNRVAKPIFVKTDADIEGLIANCLAAAGQTTGDAQAMAHLLFAAAQGIANHATTLKQAKQDIAKIVAALVP